MCEHDDDNRIEIIELPPGSILCAFVVDGVRDEDMADVQKYWDDVLVERAAEAMTKFMSNHFVPRGD